jgi:hypothetical protein
MKDRRKIYKVVKLKEGKKGGKKGGRMEGKKRERKDKKGRPEGEVNQTEGKRNE